MASDRIRPALIAVFLAAGCNDLLGNRPGHLVDDAATADGADGWIACPDDLSNLGGGNFHISFTLVTRMQGQVALLNQRQICDYSYMWDIHLSPSNPGGIDLETDDGRDYSLVSTTSVVNDGHKHKIQVTRIDGTLGIAVDETTSGFVELVLASPAMFGQLVPLMRGHSVCQSLGVQNLVGILDDVCITRW
jgi:hypothetical protein